MTRSVYPTDYSAAAVPGDDIIDVEEGASESMPFTLLDEDGMPAAPLALAYSIVCLTSGRLVRASTPLTPTATGQIPLAPSDTAFTFPQSQFELRRIVLTATYSSDDVAESNRDFRVGNFT